MKLPENAHVFVVTASVKDRSHPFYNVGSRLGFSLDGVQGRTVVLTRGQTYFFKVETGIQHDFYLATSPVGRGAATLTEGVKGNFTYKGIVRFTPNAAAPSVVYYACRNHKNMGGKIIIINPGQKAEEVLKSQSGRSSAPGRKELKKHTFVSVAQLQQKIRFAEMFINQSGAAQRISASSNEKARELHRAAQDKLKAAQDAQAEGRLNQSFDMVDDAMRLMSQASQRVPTAEQLTARKSHFKELLNEVLTFEASYMRNYERMVKKKGERNIHKLDFDRLHGEVRRARTLAEEDRYDEANKVLTAVQKTVTAALSEMLADETVSYELKFETPAEEYEYELTRFQSYAELIPIAIEQKKPSQQTVDLMNSFVEKAEGIKQQAAPEARKGNYKKAILMLQGATTHLQRALQLAGVR